MRTCANCENKNKGKNCPSPFDFDYSCWTRRRWVTLLIVAAVVVLSMVLIIGVGAALMSLTTKAVDVDSGEAKPIITVVTTLEYGDAYFHQLTTIGVCEVVTGAPAVWIVDGERHEVPTTFVEVGG